MTLVAPMGTLSSKVMGLPVTAASKKRGRWSARLRRSAEGDDGRAEIAPRGRWMPPRCDGRATRARKSAASSSPSRPKDTHQRDVRRVESGETLKNTSARRRDDGGMRRRGRRARTRGRLRRARRSDCAGERPTRRPPAAATADRRRLFAGQIHFSTTRARDADRGKRGVATRATRATTRRRRGRAWTYGSSRKSAWRLLLSSQVSSYAPVDEGDGSARWPCFNPVLQSGRRWRARRASGFLIDYSVVSRTFV